MMHTTVPSPFLDQPATAGAVVGRPVSLTSAEAPEGKYTGSVTTHLFGVGKTTAKASIRFSEAGEASLRLQYFYPEQPKESLRTLHSIKDTPFITDASTGAIELGHITQFGPKMQFGCSIRWIKHVPHMQKVVIKIDTEGWNVSGGNLTKVFKEPLELYLEGGEMGVHEALHRMLDAEQRDTRRIFSSKWWASFWPFRSRSAHSTTSYQPLLAEDMDWI